MKLFYEQIKWWWWTIL